jgi:hypothetical protein
MASLDAWFGLVAPARTRTGDHPLNTAFATAIKHYDVVRRDHGAGCAAAGKHAR